MSAIDAATSSRSAPITGATAAIAELPQTAFPHATRIARLGDKPAARPMTYAESERGADYENDDSGCQRRSRSEEPRHVHRRTEQADRDLENVLGDESNCPARRGADRQRRFAKTIPMRMAETSGSMIARPKSRSSTDPPATAQADTTTAADDSGPSARSCWSRQGGS